MKAPARVVAVLTATAVLVIGFTAPALADSPTTWVEGEQRSTLDTLILFGGGTVGLFAAITVFALLTARNNYVPPPPGTDVQVSDHHA